MADALLTRPIMPLGDLAPFNGADIYALYYLGDFAPYAPLAARNRDSRFAAPIYAGKAIPAGTRKGGRGTSAGGTPLFRRLGQHAESLTRVENLALADFACRYLVVEHIR